MFCQRFVHMRRPIAIPAWWTWCSWWPRPTRCSPCSTTFAASLLLSFNRWTLATTCEWQSSREQSQSKYKWETCV